MAPRPYFKYGIEQIQTLAASSQHDLNVLKAIQHELSFRNKPKARILKFEVDDLVYRLTSGSASSHLHSAHSSPASDLKAQSTVPDRVAIECAGCKTPNFVSTLEGVVQYLSCSSCKLPYQATFKYGVMRTEFQTKPSNDPKNPSMTWILVGLVVLVLIVLIAK